MNKFITRKEPQFSTRHISRLAKLVENTNMQGKMEVKYIAFKICSPFLVIFRVIYCYLEALFRFFVPPKLKSIDGEVILVTGATGGIGKELCRYIVKCGNKIKLVIWGTNISTLYSLTAELKSIGDLDLEVFCYEVDLSCKENVDACCRQVKVEVGSVTIIFNNAGIAPHGNFLQFSNDQIDKVIQVNLMSNLWIIRQFLPDMLTLNHGRIVNICSMGGLKAATHALPYFASKFAVNGYTEALKAELAVFQHNGVHCTTVYPYFVQTPIIQSLSLNGSKSYWSFNSLRRVLTPEEVARKIVDGMRREYEYVYCPSTIPLMLLAEYFVPKKLRTMILLSHIRNINFKDKEEENKFRTPMVPV